MTEKEKDKEIILDRGKDHIVRLKTECGFNVKPLYSPQDLEGLDYDNDLNDPGNYPFTRGMYDGMFRNMLWVDEHVLVRETIEKITIVDESSEGKILKSTGGKVRVSSIEKMDIEYDITKDVVGGGPLEPFMRDPHIEDIHIVTGSNVHLIHKVFDMIKTNIYIDNKWADRFSQEFAEKIGSPVSEGQPIADGTLPDGSRVNIIHSRDVSLKGPSMTVRKFSETPISVTQIMNWGTFDTSVGAYLWLALQYGCSIFVCGETASGKTTTSNSMFVFIPPEKKIYSVENTPEVQVPHKVWQQMLTRSTGPKESHVDESDLLRAA